MRKEQGKEKGGKKVEKQGRIKDLPRKNLTPEQERGVKGGGKLKPPPPSGMSI